MPQCQECNAGLPEGAKFCGRCGTRVASQADTALTMPVAVSPPPAAPAPAVPPPVAPPAQDWAARPGQGAGGPAQGPDAPTQGLGVPARSLGAPGQGPDAPTQGLGGPARGLDLPTQGFGAPTQGLGGQGQGLAGPTQGLGGQPQGMPGPAQGLADPAQGMAGPAQGMAGPAQGMAGPPQGPGGPAQGMGGLGYGGPAPGMAGPGQWQAGPAVPARAYPQAVPQQGGASSQAVTGGVMAILGAIGVVVACLVPVTSSVSLGLGQNSSSVSLFDEFKHGALKWFLVEPVGVAVLALIAALVIMASRSRVAPIVAAGVLLGFGIQTAFLFLGYWRGFSVGQQAGPAGIVGLLAGVLLAVAGLVAGAAAARRT